MRPLLRRAERVRQRCSTARRARSGSAPFGTNVPTRRATTSPGRTSSRRPGKRATGWVAVRDALTMGPSRGRATRSRRIPDRRPTTTPSTCSCGRCDASKAVSRWSWSAIPIFDYGRTCPPSGSLVDGEHATRPTRAAPASTIRLANRHGARHRRRPGPGAPRPRAGRAACSARCPGREGLAIARTIDEADARARPPPAALLARLVGGARAFPTTRGETLIQRSALAIKGLTYMPTGATVAAPDDLAPGDAGRRAQLGLPLHVDPRLDLHPAGAPLAQPRLGGRRVHAVRRGRSSRTEDGALQIMYGIDGRRDLTETTRDDLSGLRGRAAGARRQRRVRPAPERRLRGRAGLDPAAHAR